MTVCKTKSEFVFFPIDKNSVNQSPRDCPSKKYKAFWLLLIDILFLFHGKVNITRQKLRYKWYVSHRFLFVSCFSFSAKTHFSVVRHVQCHSKLDNFSACKIPFLLRACKYTTAEVTRRQSNPSPRQEEMWLTFVAWCEPKVRSCVVFYVKWCSFKESFHTHGFEVSISQCLRYSLGCIPQAVVTFSRRSLSKNARIFFSKCSTEKNWCLF